MEGTTSGHAAAAGVDVKLASELVHLTTDWLWQEFSSTLRHIAAHIGGKLSGPISPFKTVLTLKLLLPLKFHSFLWASDQILYIYPFILNDCLSFPIGHMRCCIPSQLSLSEGGVKPLDKLCQFITGPHTDKHPLTQFILPDIKRESIQVRGESATSTHKDSGSELNHQVTLGMPGYTLLTGVNTYYSVNNSW